MTRSRHHGFTLAELMIVVALVGILATIAVPSYRGYVERANRTVAKIALTDLMTRQTGYYTERKRYATSLSRLGMAGNTLYLDRDGAMRAANSTDVIYQLTLAGNPGSTSCPPGGSAAAAGFTLLATPVNGQVSDDRCATLCLSSAGVKGASGTDAPNCWKR